jgi:hypothetical protein
MRRFLFLTLVLLLPGCHSGGSHEKPDLEGPRRTTGLPTEDAVELPAGETAELVPDPGAARFIATYPGLRRIGGGNGIVLYPNGALEVIDRRSSSYPSNSLLSRDTVGGWPDGRVFARFRHPLRTGRVLYLAQSDGLFGDPAFYLIDEHTSEASRFIHGEILAITDSGEVSIYQRRGSVFPRRKSVTIGLGQMSEVDSLHSTIDLRTVALTRVRVRRSAEDSAVVAELARGDSLEVLEGFDLKGGDGALLRVRTLGGVEGWVSVPALRCNYGVIKGVCFLGD